MLVLTAVRAWEPSMLNLVRRRRCRGFTLVELLVVIAILGILVALGLAVGSKVTAGGKVRATEGVIKSLDAMLAEYITAREGKPSAVFKDDQGREFPLIDAASHPDGPVEPSLALFMAEATKVAAVKSMLTGLDPRFVETVTVECKGIRPRVNNADLQSQIVKDGFGRTIRFVHPAYDGGYGRSNPPSPTRPFNVAGTSYNFMRRIEKGPVSGVGIADEGMCSNKLPYFYSLGADGDPGTRDDNVYGVARPTFPAESTTTTNN